MGIYLMVIMASYRDGERPDFAKDPLISLLAFCLAFDDGPDREPSS